MTMQYETAVPERDLSDDVLPWLEFAPLVMVV